VGGIGPTGPAIRRGADPVDIETLLGDQAEYLLELVCKLVCKK